MLISEFPSVATAYAPSVPLNELCAESAAASTGMALEEQAFSIQLEDYIRMAVFLWALRTSFVEIDQRCQGLREKLVTLIYFSSYPDGLNLTCPVVQLTTCSNNIYVHMHILVRYSLESRGQQRELYGSGLRTSILNSIKNILFYGNSWNMKSPNE